MNQNCCTTTRLHTITSAGSVYNLELTSTKFRIEKAIRNRFLTTEVVNLKRV